jgi:quercetin dioxygenase-like cupin family protein
MRIPQIILLDTQFGGEKMIVKSTEGYRRNFLGVDFVVLARGKETMITKMLYKTEDRVPMHKHPNEQSGYVISGKYRLRFGEFNQLIESGDSYSIPKNIEHSIEIIEAGEVLDCFSPPRKDYL